MSMNETLAWLERLAVRVCIDRGTLRLSEPEETLPSPVREELATRRAELDALLAVRAAAAPEAPARLAPLSFAQQRLWLMMQLDDDHSPLHLRHLLHLRGAVDLDALEWSLGQIIQRHEALRTRFVDLDGEPFQAIGETESCRIDFADIRGQDDPMREAIRRADALLARSYRLANEPPLRCLLLRLGATEHVMAIVLPHLVSDGWSSGVILGELSQLYAGRVQGRSVHLEPPGLQLAAWAERERRDYAARKEALLAHWKANLDGLATLELPADRPRAADLSSAGRRRAFPIPAADRRRLADLGRAERCTPFMTMVTVFQVLLARYSGQEDIVIGTPHANREAQETWSVVGPLLNTLLLRSDLSGNPTFRELLRRVREVALQAYSNDAMPFEELLAELRPERDPSRNPLFQVMINALPNVGTPALADLEVQTIESEVLTSLVDLSLILGGDHGALEYRIGLFDEATIARMQEHFLSLLEAAASEPDRSIWELRMLTRADREQLDRLGAGPAREPKAGCLPAMLGAVAQRLPNAPAIREAGRELRLCEVVSRVRRLARHLRALGASKGTVVAVCLPRSADAVIAMLAAIEAGAAYLPLDPAYPAARLGFLIEDSQAKLLVTRGSVRAALPPSGPRVVDLERDAGAIAACSDTELPERPQPGDAAYVIYTSGSTGVPKGVVGPHRGAVNRLEWMYAEVPYAPAEVCCLKTSLGFVDSIFEILGPLLAGVPLVVIPDDAAADVSRLVPALAETSITRIVLVPSLLRSILDATDVARALPRLSTWICSGEQLTAELSSRFVAAAPGARLLNFYGSSEVAADATWYDVAEGLPPGSGVPIGRPIWNTRVLVLDAHGQVVPLGVFGEIHAGGAGLAQGYLGRPDLTSERFVQDRSRAGERLYRTGDRGRWLASGALAYAGRLDRQEKIRGFRIEPGEIEHALAEHAAVEECAVVVQTKPSGERQLVAHVVLAADASATVSELRTFLRARLPAPLVPGPFHIADGLPHLPSGKIDRKALERAAAPQEQHGFVPPRTRTEEALARIWGEVLEIARIGRDDRFLDLGGHSLLVVKVLSRIKAELGLRVRFGDLLAQSLAQLATQCDAAGKVAASAG